eukprot:m.111407 g.111407  ORF g.111407 m.111407 type:complete len:103 (+) comp22776_c1_seq9:77-385(+)
MEIQANEKLPEYPECRRNNEQHQQQTPVMPPTARPKTPPAMKDRFEALLNQHDSVQVRPNWGSLNQTGMSERLRALWKLDLELREQEEKLLREGQLLNLSPS